MTKFKKILAPVDLSDDSQATIDFAADLAKCHDAEIVLCYIETPVVPPDAMYGQSEPDQISKQDMAAFERVKPTDDSIKFRHEFLYGNPGPEIVRLAKNLDCDLIVMKTHGRTGFSRLLLGSVAEYVVRHSTVPVVTLKTPYPRLHQTEEGEKEAEQKSTSQARLTDKTTYVTTLMTHVVPIDAEDEMPTVISELNDAKATAAPVIDGLGKCIGILTQTDIQNYLGLQQRLRNQDESVLDEVFTTDEFGMRRPNLAPFHRVAKHMTSPVITISNKTTREETEKIFVSNPTIHHLVIVDEENHPIGMIRFSDLFPLRPEPTTPELSA